MITCEYCESNFKSLKVLNYHQKNTKYCLKKQGKIIEDDSDVEELYICQTCNKFMKNERVYYNHIKICNTSKEDLICPGCKTECSSKHCLSKHTNICLSYKLCKQIEEYELVIQEHVEKYNNLYEKFIENSEKLEKYETNYKKYIEEKEVMLQEKYEKKMENHIIRHEQHTETIIKTFTDKFENVCTKAINKPTSIKNINTINNTAVFNLSQSDIENKCKRFNDSNMKNGMRGIAFFTADKVLKNENGDSIYKCTDIARNMFKFIDSDGNTVKDPNASKLTQMIQPTLKIQCNRYKNMCEDKIQELNKIIDNCRQIIYKDEYVKELEDIQDLYLKMLDINFKVVSMHKDASFSKELANFTC